MLALYFNKPYNIPSNTRHIATDEGGNVYAFTNDKPEFNNKAGTWCVYTQSYELIGCDPSINPETSLVTI